MSIKIVLTECFRCGSPHIENPYIGLCASCAAAARKEERNSRKVKMVHPIPKVSQKRSKQMHEYSELREMFLNMEPNHFCHVAGCKNQATEVHHQKGREGDLLLNTLYFMAVCRTCHVKITEDSNWAFLNGYSEKRTI